MGLGGFENSVPVQRVLLEDHPQGCAVLVSEFLSGAQTNNSIFWRHNFDNPVLLQIMIADFKQAGVNELGNSTLHG